MQWRSLCREQFHDVFYDGTPVIRLSFSGFLNHNGYLLRTAATGWTAGVRRIVCTPASESLKCLTFPSWIRSFTAPATSFNRDIRVDTVLTGQIDSLDFEASGSKKTDAHRAVRRGKRFAAGGLRKSVPVQS
jgi:hypothetical protein